MDIPVEKIVQFEGEFLEYMDTHHKELGQEIVQKKVISDELSDKIESAIEEFKKIFLAEV